MDFIATWTQLQERLQAFEAVMLRRESVIRFLLARLLLMLTMVLIFWVGVQHTLGS
jgi:hypothetical protein